MFAKEGRNFIAVTQDEGKPTNITFFEEIPSKDAKTKSSFFLVEDQALIDLLLMQLDEALKSR